MKEMLDHPFFLSYQVGLNLAVNAIRDSYLVVDGPNCVIFRTSQIQGNHDWCSDLLRSSGLHRVADTDCTTERAAIGDDRLLLERLRMVDQQPDCALVMLSSMSPVAVTGRQYDKIIKEMEPEFSNPVVTIPCGSLEGDWLHGYSNTLHSLAEQLPLKKGKLCEKKVGVVGYLWDRNEGDHKANRDELERLLGEIGLETVSWWLGGNRVDELSAIGEARTIISFPHARTAAQTLAKRTGANLITCDLPMGLEGTISWLRQIATPLGRLKQAEELVDRYLETILPKLKWIVPHGLFGKNIVVVADPYLGLATSRALEELGCNIVLRANWSNVPIPDSSTEQPYQTEGKILDKPSPGFFSRELKIIMESEGVDLIITNSNALISHVNERNTARIPFLELGFPSFYTHHLYPSPYMGFGGILRLVDRVYNALSKGYVQSATKFDPTKSDR